jgi:hypothetical protein
MVAGALHKLRKHTAAAGDHFQRRATAAGVPFSSVQHKARAG